MIFDLNKIPFNWSWKIKEDLREHPVDSTQFEAAANWIIDKSLNFTDPLEQAKAKSFLAFLLRVLGQQEKAYYEIHKSFRLFIQAQGFIPVNSYIRLAQILQWQKDFNEADSLYLEIINKLKREDDSKILDFAFQHYGKSLFEQGRFTEAKDYFEKALKIRKEKKMPELIQSTQFSLDVINSILLEEY